MIFCFTHPQTRWRTFYARSKQKLNSVLEAYRNFNIRKNTVNGDIVQLKVGSTLSSYLTIQEGSNITMSTPNTSSNSIIELKSQKQIKLDTPDVYITGTLSSTNIGVKSPIFFTTNRNMTINGISFSVYDIDLRKYTKSVLLDGYNIRQFRIRHWPANADFETGPSTYQYHLKRYDIFMSNRNGLSIFALCAPIDNQLLTETFKTNFLYSNTFDYLIYCSRYGAVKVYCIIEYLL